MRLVLLVLATCAGVAGCIDFRDGLACSSDAECLGYLCVAATCAAPIVDDGAAGGGGTTDRDQPATVASGQKNARSLRADSTTLYWLAEDNDRLKVRKALKTGNNSSEIADLGALPSTTARPAMVLGTDSLFVAAGTKVFKVPKIGGASTTLTSSGSNYGGGIGVSGSTLLWLSPGTTGSVWKMPISGGVPEQVATNVPILYSLVASGSEAYWSMRDGIAVYDVIAGTTSTFAMPAGTFAKGLAISGTSVTWLECSPFCLTVGSTQVGSTSASAFKVDQDLIAAAPDGVQKIFAISAAKESSSSTGLFVLSTSDGKYSYVRATGGSSGLASEVVVDAANVYLVVQDSILRRAR